MQQVIIVIHLMLVLCPDRGGAVAALGGRRTRHRFVWRLYDQPWHGQRPDARDRDPGRPVFRDQPSAVDFGRDKPQAHVDPSGRPKRADHTWCADTARRSEGACSTNCRVAHRRLRRRLQPPRRGRRCRSRNRNRERGAGKSGPSPLWSNVESETRNRSRRRTENRGANRCKTRSL